MSSQAVPPRFRTEAGNVLEGGLLPGIGFRIRRGMTGGALFRYIRMNFMGNFWSDRAPVLVTSTRLPT